MSKPISVAFFAQQADVAFSLASAKVPEDPKAKPGGKAPAAASPLEDANLQKLVISTPDVWPKIRKTNLNLKNILIVIHGDPKSEDP